VRADPGAVYYIGDTGKTAVIQTDTDWSGAKFIIDDSAVSEANCWRSLFMVTSALAPVPVAGVGTLKKGQAKLDISLGYDSYMVATDDTVMRYIRYRPENQDAYRGEPQSDHFIVDRSGNVDPRTPIIWDFGKVTALTAYPIDPQPLTIRGGNFTTIVPTQTANSLLRNIGVERSNVVLDGISHELRGELGKAGKAFGYYGFFRVERCANVTVQNCAPWGHQATGGDGYDIQAQHVSNITFRNCKQANDVHDTAQAGITGTNCCKNMVFDTVELNRIDSHMFVTGLTIQNSVIGYHGISVTGKGTLLVENSRLCGDRMIRLRDDFGSVWDGDVVIRNCEFCPLNGARADAVMITGAAQRAHDFGYPCAMPEKITIDGLVIDDSNHPLLYLGPKLFDIFYLPDQAFLSNLFTFPKQPYAVTEEIAVRNLTVKSGRPWFLSWNVFMFRRWFFPTTRITML
jgi:hypothetical protein